jgi:hypothetical protein
MMPGIKVSGKIWNHKMSDPTILAQGIVESQRLSLELSGSIQDEQKR